MSLGSANLTPNFDSEIFYYNAETTNLTNTITAIASDLSSDIKIDVDGVNVISGSSAVWNEGINNVSIKVSNDTDMSLYTIIVNKK